MAGLADILEKLGLNKSNGLYYRDENAWRNETQFPNRVKRLLERKILPEAFFCFDNKPLILFFENPANKEELYKAIWNFNECPVAIIIENDTVEILNGFHYLKEKGTLEKLGGLEKLNDFNYFQLVTGRTWEQYQDHLSYKNRIDYHLLNNIKAARKKLVESHKLKAKIANAIIGKIIFVRYLIDRKVKMKFDEKLRTWTNEEFCELLKDTKLARQFFDYLEDSEKGFNGDLFPISPGDYNKISKDCYEVLRNLLSGHDIDTNQPSLFELYDFSIIPIEFISNVYELFIGEDNQKSEGAYYTPLFLVDYILKETVEKHLNSLPADTLPVSGYSYCRVLDPACGSGIFLVETLRKIIEKYISDSQIDVKSKPFKTAIKNLAISNIYGVDKDLSAVQVAIFSIYLTLLDYLEPPGIETFKFPVLFGSNFFHADFFDEEEIFSATLKAMEFRFILGNPPWKGNGMDDIGKQYLVTRRSKEKTLQKKFEIAINNNEIAEGFILRASDFTSSNTQISFIIRSSSLYNLGYKEDYSDFRRYWLEEFFIDRVFELSPVRHEVFEKSNRPAIAPAAVIFYRYANGSDTSNNIVEHISLKQSRFFSLFKIFTINRTDFKKIEQLKLKTYDWLWKVLVYGSYLDFNFIKRLKDQFSTIRKLINDSSKLIEGTGIQYSVNPNYDSRHLIGQQMVDSYAIEPFFINPDKINEFEKKKVHRLRDERLFKAPMLLVREGIDMETLTARCAISKKNVLFKDSITSIKAISKNDVSYLKKIAAIFSSSLFAYYAVNMFASIGIERERVKNYNKYSLPFIDADIDVIIDNLESLQIQLWSQKQKFLHDNFKIHELETSITAQLKELNKLILEKAEINRMEAAILDYTLAISRNLIIGNDLQKSQLFAPLAFGAVELEEYAATFVKRFKKGLESTGKQFNVEIWHNDKIVGMIFRLNSVGNNTKSIEWINKENQDTNFLSTIVKLSSKKITDKLFVQKDIRGFEPDFFYIFKPNEKRLWHKALSFLDVNEFSEAILHAGRRQK